MTFLPGADIEETLVAELGALGYQTITEVEAGPSGMKAVL